RIVVERRDPVELEPELSGALARLDIEVPEDLEVIGDEADRTHQHAPDTVLRQPAELLQDVGPEPRLAGGTGALESKGTVGDAGPLAKEPRGLEQLVAVRVAFSEDPLRERVRREHDVAVEAPHALRQHLKERLPRGPALAERE